MEIKEIRASLSGGVDSSVVTMLGHLALGEKLKAYFIENGLLRQDEPRSVARLFRKLDIHVEILDARSEFFGALKGLRDPEDKRGATTQTFYKKVKAFQYMAILHEDKFPGMRAGKRDSGLQIEIRCWRSVDARTAKPVWLAPRMLEKLARRISGEVPGVVSVTYNIAPKPPSTMEAV